MAMHATLGPIQTNQIIPAVIVACNETWTLFYSEDFKLHEEGLYNTQPAAGRAHQEPPGDAGHRLPDEERLSGRCRRRTTAHRVLAGDLDRE